MAGMASSVVLGIDLGTTNSVVAVADGGTARVLEDLDGQRLIPSVVSFVEDGSVLVGELGRERRLTDAENTIYAIKRLIGRPYTSPEVERAQQRFAFRIVEGSNGGVRVEVRGQAYSLAEISAYVLRECRRVAEQMLSDRVEQAVITVPANFNELQRSATKAAGKVAGLQVLRILNEPTAAAVAYGCGTNEHERVAVYDFGGGTFDVTILDLDDDVFEVVATAGDTFLGGDDLDLLVAEAFADHLAAGTGWDPRSDRQAFERLRAAAEWTKCKLSTEEEITTRVRGLHTTARGTEIDLEMTLRRSDFENMIEPLVRRSSDVCRDALGLGDVHIGSIDSVLLVGGSTRIPLVRRTVEELFGRSPRTDIDPDLVVALGASIQAYALSAKKPRRAVSTLPGPTVQDADRVRKRKARARAERPEQPAFAPQERIESVQPPPVEPPDAQAGPPQLPGLPPPAPVSVTTRAIFSLSEPPPDASAEPEGEVAAGHRSPEPPRRRTEQAYAPPAPASPGQDELGEPFDPDRGLELVDFGSLVPQAGATPLEPREMPSQAPVRIVTADAERHAGATHSVSGPPAPPGDVDALLTELDIDDLDALVETVESSPPKGLARTGSPRMPPVLDAGLVGLVPPAAPAPEGPPPPPPPRQAPPRPSPPRPFIQMSERPPPLLMDVTPHSLGIEAVGGYCERIIRRNAPIPVEQTRIFSTAQDNQIAVMVAVCQGEDRIFERNQLLGEIELAGLRAASRGQVKIEVSFMLDASGTLDVNARDMETGRVQTIRISLLGGFSERELHEMQERQEMSLGQ